MNGETVKETANGKNSTNDGFESNTVRICSFSSDFKTKDRL